MTTAPSPHDNEEFEIIKHKTSIPCSKVYARSLWISINTTNVICKKVNLILPFLQFWCCGCGDVVGCGYRLLTRGESSSNPSPSFWQQPCSHLKVWVHFDLILYTYQQMNIMYINGYMISCVKPVHVCRIRQP